MYLWMCLKNDYSEIIVLIHCLEAHKPLFNRTRSNKHHKVPESSGKCRVVWLILQEVLPTESCRKFIITQQLTFPGDIIK